MPSHWLIMTRGRVSTDWRSTHMPGPAETPASGTFDRSRLTTHDHSRTAAGFTYVYPVLSRRSDGLSIGINLNPNNACNWQCIYCQVPDLTRGSAPAINLPRLETELSTLLDQIAADQAAQADVGAAQPPPLRDVAISGNGEPTSCGQLGAVIELIVQILETRRLLHQVSLIIITNGSLVHQPRVQDCLGQWDRHGGTLWFKVDSATRHGLATRNGARTVPTRVLANLIVAAKLCTTWVQTCVFTLDGSAPSEADNRDYINLLQTALQAGAPLAGILLYGLARPSMQPDAQRLAPVPSVWLDNFACSLRKLGLPVKVTP